jgi:SAM-dependent methyltransferase
VDTYSSADIELLVSNEADMAYRRRVKTIFEWLKPSSGDVILDGGCGRGFYLNFISHASRARILGIEIDYPVIKVARKRLSNRDGVSVANASLFDLPIASNSIDKALLSEVLEHVDDDVAALRSVKRVLKGGGLIAITVPNANYPFWWDPINRTLESVFNTHIKAGPFAGIWANHIRLYSPDQLRQAVVEAGLEPVEERGFTHYCFPFIHNIVYGFGKTLLEAGALPSSMVQAGDRFELGGKRGSPLNPVNIGLTLFEFFDRSNQMNEPEGRSTVNLCILARNP